MPGVVVVSDAVEGTFVDLDGESCSEQEEAKLSRRGREGLRTERGECLEKNPSAIGSW